MTIGPPEAPTTDPERTGALLEKTAGGAGWTNGWRAATRALGFLSTLVLARILVPADFGLVALAMSFSRAIDIFADIGVQDALVRASHNSRATYDAAFTANAVRGGITAVVIAVSAGPFAKFFGDPRLFYVVLALGLAVLLDARKYRKLKFAVEGEIAAEVGNTDILQRIEQHRQPKRQHDIE